MADLKPLSKEERVMLYNQHLASADEEDYARLGEYIARALATIDQMEQRQQKLVEALERLQAWPPCYPANANIERMREYAYAALHPTEPSVK